MSTVAPQTRHSPHDQPGYALLRPLVAVVFMGRLLWLQLVFLRTCDLSSSFCFDQECHLELRISPCSHSSVVGLDPLGSSDRGLLQEVMAHLGTSVALT